MSAAEPPASRSDPGAANGILGPELSATAATEPETRPVLCLERLLGFLRRDMHRSYDTETERPDELRRSRLICQAGELLARRYMIHHFGQGGAAIASKAFALMVPVSNTAEVLRRRPDISFNASSNSSSAPCTIK